MGGVSNAPTGGHEFRFGKLTSGLMREDAGEVETEKSSTVDKSSIEETKELRSTLKSGTLGERKISDIKGLLLPKETSIVGIVKNFFNIPKRLSQAEVKKQLGELQKELKGTSGNIDRLTGFIKEGQSKLSKLTNPVEIEAQQAQLTRNEKTLSLVMRDWDVINGNLEALKGQMGGTKLENSKVTKDLVGTQSDISRKIKPFTYHSTISPFFGKGELAKLAEDKFKSGTPSDIRTFVEEGAGSQDLIKGLGAALKSSTPLQKLAILVNLKEGIDTYERLGKADEAKAIIGGLDKLLPINEFFQELRPNLAKEGTKKQLEDYLSLKGDPVALARELAATQSSKLLEMADRFTILFTKGGLTGTEFATHYLSLLTSQSLIKPEQLKLFFDKGGTLDSLYENLKKYNDGFAKNSKWNASHGWNTFKSILDREEIKSDPTRERFKNLLFSGPIATKRYPKDLLDKSVSNEKVSEFLRMGGDLSSLMREVGSFNGPQLQDALDKVSFAVEEQSKIDPSKIGGNVKNILDSLKIENMKGIFTNSSAESLKNIQNYLSNKGDPLPLLKALNAMIDLKQTFENTSSLLTPSEMLLRMNSVLDLSKSASNFDDLKLIVDEAQSKIIESITLSTVDLEAIQLRPINIRTIHSQQILANDPDFEKNELARLKTYGNVDLEKAEALIKSAGELYNKDNEKESYNRGSGNEHGAIGTAANNTYEILKKGTEENGKPAVVLDEEGISGFYNDACSSLIGSNFGVSFLTDGCGAGQHAQVAAREAIKEAEVYLKEKLGQVNGNLNAKQLSQILYEMIPHLQKKLLDQFKNKNEESKGETTFIASMYFTDKEGTVHSLTINCGDPKAYLIGADKKVTDLTPAARSQSSSKLESGGRIGYQIDDRNLRIAHQVLKKGEFIALTSDGVADNVEGTDELEEALPEGVLTSQNVAEAWVSHAAKVSADQAKASFFGKHIEKGKCDHTTAVVVDPFAHVKALEEAPKRESPFWVKGKAPGKQ